MSILLSEVDGWHPMVVDDLADVLAIANKCHPDYPEEEAVFREKLNLFQAGCSILRRNRQIVGYIISHPYLFGRAVPLNTLLITLPANANTLYIHDISIDLGNRGQGLASEAVAHAKRTASNFGFDWIGLVAVNGSEGFWEGHGFRCVPGEQLEHPLVGYGEAGTYMICKIC